MKRNTTITLFYTGVAVISAATLGLAFYLRSRFPEPDMSSIVNVGKETTDRWFEIGNDLSATNQDGKTVKLSDLKGKVWIAAEFFAICPHCAVRNGEELDYPILCNGAALPTYSHDQMVPGNPPAPTPQEDALLLREVARGVVAQAVKSGLAAA